MDGLGERRLPSCQRCGELADRCDCPTFVGEPHMECRRCGALQGAHLLDFTLQSDDPQERLICPAP